jgi:DNA-binding response OmpR family regulator
MSPSSHRDPILTAERFAVRVGDGEVVLTPTQFRVLAVLVAEPGRVFRRAELVAQGIGSVVTEQTVDAHVKELRRKLGPLGLRLETVRGIGFRYARPS